MKKIVTCLIGILFFVFPVVARDALTADLRLSLIGGGTWVNGTTELNKKSVDYKTNWQPFGVQESCDFFIHGFFVGIHEEIGLAAANLNTKDFKTVGNYTYDGTPAKHSTNNLLYFIHIGPVFALRPAKVISFNAALIFGFEQMWYASTEYGSYPHFFAKSDSEYAHGFSMGLDLSTRLRFNRFLIVGGVKTTVMPFPKIISASSKLIEEHMGDVNPQAAFSVKGHIGFGIEIGERL